MVAEVEVRRPPNNHVSVPMIAELSAALEHLDTEPGCRVVVLCAAGKHFCAGADSPTRSRRARPDGMGGRHLYKEAIRLWRTKKPIVAAVQGAAVGAGLGLAVAADFRVSCPEARFSANFTGLGFHPGFGLTATLPRLIGVQHAGADDVHRPGASPARRPRRWASSINSWRRTNSARRRISSPTRSPKSAPLAIVSARETLRRGLAAAVQAATEREYQEQNWLRHTDDFREGVRAMADRRTPEFKGA